MLVVDDEAKVRAYLRRVLTKLGHEVSEAPDGAEALRLLDASAFDLVITDAYMAEMDGMELLARIQQRGLRVPVVMMSGGGYMKRGDVLTMGASSGAVATLEKPFTPEQLRLTIEPMLSGAGPVPPTP